MFTFRRHSSSYGVVYLHQLHLGHTTFCVSDQGDPATWLRPEPEVPGLSQFPVLQNTLIYVFILRLANTDRHNTTGQDLHKAAATKCTVFSEHKDWKEDKKSYHGLRSGQYCVKELSQIQDDSHEDCNSRDRFNGCTASQGQNQEPWKGVHNLAPKKASTVHDMNPDPACHHHVLRDINEMNRIHNHIYLTKSS